jgi:hypothetical protein
MRSACITLTSVALALAFAAQPAFAADAQVVITGDVEVERGQTVGDVVIAEGSVDVAGRVDGDLVIFSGPADITGRVDGDVTIFDGVATVARGGVVDGDINYGDDKPVIAPGGEVTGDVNEEDWSDGSFAPLAVIGHIALWIAFSISTLALGFLMIWLTPRVFTSAERVARESFWLALSIGFGIFVVIPIVAVVAVGTLVGLPLGVAILLALAPIAAVAYVTAAAVLGRLVAGGAGAFVSFLAGWGILRAAALIPVLGMLVGFVATVAGMGLLGMALWRARSSTTPPGTAPDPAPA